MSAAPPPTTYTYRSNVGTGAWYGFGQHGRGLGRLGVAGGMGFCAVCLLCFGVFFLLGGTIMTVTSYTGFQQDHEFFHDSPVRIIGPIFLGLGFISVLVGVGLCCAARRQADSGLTTITQQHSAPGPVGYNPTGYTPSAQPGYNPSGQPPYNPSGSSLYPLGDPSAPPSDAYLPPPPAYSEAVSKY